jgi:hypothetical protein
LLKAEAKHIFQQWFTGMRTATGVHGPSKRAQGSSKLPRFCVEIIKDKRLPPSPQKIKDELEKRNYHRIEVLLQSHLITGLK